jgi:UMF1 family MFS transporter
VAAHAKTSGKLAVFGWLSYDFANTIFSMNILTMYFAQWIIVDLKYPDIYYSLTYSASMIAVAVTMPMIGNFSDRSARYKSFLVVFTFGCILATAVLGISVYTTSNIALLAGLGLVCVALANYFYEGGLVFYNSLLPSVSTDKNVGMISGMGVGLGYIGAITGLLIVQPIVDGSVPLLPVGRQSAFLPTALLFLVFAIPSFLFLKQNRIDTLQVDREDASGARGLLASLKEASKHRAAFRFLMAKFLFEDAIATLIIFMAVYAEKVMGFPDNVKISLFIVSTVSAVLGSIAVGRLSDRIGHYRMLKMVIIGWVILLVVVSATTSKSLYWVLGSVFGVLLGSTWTVSRPLLIQLAPRERLGLFYGLYSLTGKAAAVLGPLVWGMATLHFTSSSLPAKLVGRVATAFGLQLSEPVLNTIEYRFAVLSLACVTLGGLLIYLSIPRVKNMG